MQEKAEVQAPPTDPAGRQTETDRDGMLTSSSSPGSTDTGLRFKEQGQGTLAPDSRRPVGSWDHEEPLPWVESGGEALCGQGNKKAACKVEASYSGRSRWQFPVAGPNRLPLALINEGKMCPDK